MSASYFTHLLKLIGFNKSMYLGVAIVLLLVWFIATYKSKADEQPVYLYR